MQDKKEAAMTRIFIAGDSTNAQNDITTFPQTGLGQGLELYIKKEIKIHNHAMNGRSSKSFIEEGRLAAIEKELAAGDFLFIQFGHNDEKEFDPARYTTPHGTYKTCLKAYIQVARKAGATPVLITPLERRCFEDAWKLGPGEHAEYVSGMKELAEEEQVALLDLYTKSRARMEEAGAVETTKWFMHLAKGEYPSCPEGKVDNTHLKQEGARIFAGLIADELKRLGGIYGALVVEGYGKAVEAKYDTVIEA